MTEKNTRRVPKEKDVDLWDNDRKGCITLIVLPIAFIAILGIIVGILSRDVKRKEQKTPSYTGTTGVLKKEKNKAENAKEVDQAEMEESIRSMLLAEAQGIMKEVEKHTDGISHLDLGQIETSQQRGETLKTALSVSEKGIAAITEMEKIHRAALKERNMEDTQWANETFGLFNTSLDYCKNAHDAAKSWQAFFDGADRKNLDNAQESYMKMQNDMMAYSKYKRVIDSFISRPGGPWLMAASFSDKDTQKEYKTLRDSIK